MLPASSAWASTALRKRLERAREARLCLSRQNNNKAFPTSLSMNRFDDPSERLIDSLLQQQARGGAMKNFSRRSRPSSMPLVPPPAQAEEQGGAGPLLARCGRRDLRWGRRLCLQPARAPRTTGARRSRPPRSRLPLIDRWWRRPMELELPAASRTGITTVGSRDGSRGIGCQSGGRSSCAFSCPRSGSKLTARPVGEVGFPNFG